MKIISHCSHCDKQYQLDAGLLGKKAKCSDCKEEFIIQEKIIEENSVSNTVVENTVTNKVIEKSEDLIIKPNKKSFIFLNKPLIFFVILGCFSLLIHIFIALAFFVIAGIFFGLYTVIYNKSLYTITDRKLIYKTGSLISDNTVEVNLDKITLVQARLGFLQNKIFKTGNLYVKTAGSSSSKINFIHIENTLEIYEELQSRMRKNGFNLKKDKLVQTAKPHALGVLGEIFGKVATFGIFAIYLSVGLIAAIQEVFSGANLGFFTGGVVAGVFGIIALSILIFSYLDLKRRKYEVFTDSIFYTEGFLTKNYSFIPMENISDTENQQSFLSKLFGLHDVIISSQGASNKVMFKNMVGGQKMMESIKFLKDKTIMGTKNMIVGEEEKESLIGFKNKIEEPLNYNKEFKGEFRMNILKSMASVLFTVILLSPMIYLDANSLIIIFIIIIPSIIKIAIAIFSTKFIVTESSIDYKYDFLSHKYNSFSVEKITKVTLVESLLDKVFGTCSIKFNSIGSGSSIVFKNIKKTDDIYDKLLSKVGIHLDENSKSLPIKFNVIECVKSNVFGILILFILAIVSGIFGQFIISIVIFIFLLFVYFCLTLFYSKKFYTNHLYKNFIVTKKGIIIQKTDLALYRHMKSTHSTKNIATSVGNITLNVAGEQVAETKGKNKGNLGTLLVSNAIHISYVDKSHEYLNVFDSIFLDKSVDQDEIISSKEDPKNTLSVLGFCAIIGVIITHLLIHNPVLTWSLTVLIFIIIGIVYWNIKVRKYSMQKDRVLYTSGIFYKKILSIPYIRFNFIENNTGFINKIFGNGNVGIFTIGSGKKEMNIKDVSNYVDVYNLLNKDS